jgi:6-phosphogluconolactonase (cycloisomerase 2 family)
MQRVSFLGLLLALGACSGAEHGAHVYAGGGSTIDVFHLDLAAGTLTLEAEVPAGDNAYLVDVDSARKHAYVQTQIGLPVAIRAFDIASDGALTKTADYPLPHPFVEGVTQILLDPTGRWLQISSTGGASGLLDQLFPVGAGGQLGPPQTISSDFYGFGWDGTGQYLYGLDGVAINQYHFDLGAGAIAPNDPPQAEGSTGHQVLGLQLHPSGKWVYSVEENAIGIFATGARGTLVGQGYAYNLVPGEPMTWASIVVHPSGRFLYAVGNVAGSLVALVDVFTIDQTTGLLRFLERQKGQHQIRLGSLQGPLLLGDFLIIGGQGTERYEGKPVLCVYRVAADGSLATLGAPAELRPADTTIVNFVFGVLE